MEKCKRDKKTGRHSGEWTDEIVEYLVEIFEGRPVAETREMINKRFGTHFSHEAVKDRGYYLGLKSGTNTGRFRSGVASGRGLPVGTVAFINYNGSHKGNSLFIKVSDTVYSDGETYLNWKPYKEYVWEQHNGKIPDNCFIVCADGDEKNCDISNLRCIPKKFVQNLSRYNKWYGKGADILDAGIAWCELKEELKKKNAAFEESGL